MINKDVRKPLARKKVNEILIWSWNDSPITYHMSALIDYFILYIFC